MFVRRQKEAYTLREKKELGEFVAKHKDQYNEEVRALAGKTAYDYRRKRHVAMKPKQGFLVAAVRNFYTDLKKVKHDNPELVKALKFATRYHEKYTYTYRITFMKGNNLPQKVS